MINVTEDNIITMLKEISDLVPGDTKLVAQVVKAKKNEEHTQKILECVLAIRKGKPLPKSLPDPEVTEAYLKLAQVVKAKAAPAVSV